MPATTTPLRRASRGARLARLALALLLICPLTLAKSPASAAATEHQVTQVAVGGTTNESLGASLGLSGDTLVAGAPSGAGRGPNTGLARVFVHNPTGWSQQATLIAPDGVYNDGFGAAVAIDGDTIAVGAPRRSGDAGMSWAGAAYVFTRSNGVWSLQATLIPNDRVNGGYQDFFGRALAIEGDTLVIASDKIGNGAAYVFTRTGAVWSQRAKLRASDGGLYSDFGDSIAISQGSVLVGAPGHSAAYVFEQGASGWAERQKLVSGAAPADSQRRFGQAVAIDGDTLVVGATRLNADSPPAAAYVFTRANGSWTRRATLDANEDPEAASFGAAVAIDGGTIVVGALYRHLDPDVPYWIGGAGAAHVYRGSGEAWTYAALLSGDQLQPIGKFGAAVLAAGDTLVVGAPRSAGPGGSDDGHIYEARASALTQAAADRPTAPEDTPATIQVLANDAVGPTGSLLPVYVDLALLRRPQHGTASVDRVGGTIVYTPTKDFNGDDTFTYVAGWGLPASVTVTVAPVPDPPVFTSQPPTGAVERVPYTYRVATADPDPGDKLALTSDALPAWLALQDNGDGTAVLTGTAALADVGAYPISLTTRDSAGLSATQVFTISVRRYLPAAPTNLAAKVISRSQVRLSWTDASVDENGFAIERRDDGGAWVRVGNVGPNVTTFTDTGRTCNTRYDYRVLAINANGSSPASNVDGVTIADCTLDSPIQLFATVETTHSLMVRWADRSDNESGFTIERSDDGVAWQLLAQTPPNSTYYPDRNLICGPGYFYRVRAFNPGGPSDPSNSIHTSVCPPAAPTNLSAAPATQNGVALAWADNSDNELGFKIESSRDGGAQWSLAAIAGTNATTYTVGRLTCGTTYRFRVQAYNGSGSAQSDSASGAPASCTVIYVDDSATGSDDGSSWASAYTDLQQALADAAGRPNPANVQIWVAAGTYKPTSGADRAASFRLINGAALYGGFAGTESALEDRDWRASPTILSGDIGVTGDMSDNSYHVVASASASPATLLDGFTITAGNANGSWLEGKNAGGGMYNATSSPTVHNTNFIANSADTGGGMANVGTGAIYVTGSYPAFDHVMFLGNSASSGGGMANSYGGGPTLVDVVFSGNHANTGGAIANYLQSGPVLINVTFSRNSAQTGRAIYNADDSRPAIRNSILWGDTAAESPEIFDGGTSATDVRFSIVAGGRAGQGNQDADPRFADADGSDNIAGTLDDDLRLGASSPAIDAGDSAAVPGDSADIDGDGDTAERLPLDLGRNPRFVDDSSADTGAGPPPIVDLGAYERQNPRPPGEAPLLTINYTTGRPGSAFLVTGNGFTPAARLRVTVNGVTIGDLTSDAVGAFTATIETLPAATAGLYQLVVASAAGEALAGQSPAVAYVLDQTAPLRAKETSRYELLVPLAARPAGKPAVFLPIVRC